MLTIAIQAGGRSTRMGADKALLPLAGTPLIEHVLNRVRGLGDELLITTNHPEKFAYLGIRTVPDLLPERGSLIGLHSALHWARHEHVLAIACDMPFIQRELVESLIDLAHQADVVVPHFQGEYEPFHAIYARMCIPAIEMMVERNQRRMISFYERVSVYRLEEREILSVDPLGLSFFNINTPEDFARAEEIYNQMAVE